MPVVRAATFLAPIIALLLLAGITVAVLRAPDDDARVAEDDTPDEVEDTETPTRPDTDLSPAPDLDGTPGVDTTPDSTPEATPDVDATPDTVTPGDTPGPADGDGARPADEPVPDEEPAAPGPADGREVAVDDRRPDILPLTGSSLPAAGLAALALAGGLLVARRRV